MSTTFKTKNKIKRVKKNDLRVTLDAKHEEKKNYFKDLQATLKEKEIKLKNLENEQINIEKIKLENLSSDELDHYLDVKDSIIELGKEINNIKNNKEETSYLLNTGQLVFKYYENINKIAQGEKPTKSKEIKKKDKGISESKTVVDFFQNKKDNNLIIMDKIKSVKIDNQESINQQDNNLDKNNSDNNNCNSINKLLSNDSIKDNLNRPEDLNNKNNQTNLNDANNNKNFYQSRIDILNQYLSIVDNIYHEDTSESMDFTICKNCGAEMYIIQHEAISICKDCGASEYLMIDSDKPSYKDPPKEISYFAYKRINHFNEWLAQFQAKESTDIPDSVYEQVLLEIKKERIDNMANLKPKKLRDLLKKLKLNKYYEHVPHIINRLNGIPAPVMSRETEEILRMMFKEIQNPFMKYCPKDRKNFLSYSYVLHKFVQLLNLDEFLICFPLLKSREKLHQQDLIWKKICEDLKWEFVKSL